MKKIILLFAIAMIFVSCQGPVGPEGPQGYGTNWKIINLVAGASDWKENFDSQGRFYTCHFSMPEITSFVYTDGSIVSYYVSSGLQIALPYVQHKKTTAGYLWTQTIDYDYSVGGMNIRVTNSDFAVDPPLAMNFRVVLMW